MGGQTTSERSSSSAVCPSRWTVSHPKVLLFCQSTSSRLSQELGFAMPARVIKLFRANPFQLLQLVVYNSNTAEDMLCDVHSSTCRSIGLWESSRLALDRRVLRGHEDDKFVAVDIQGDHKAQSSPSTALLPQPHFCNIASGAAVA